MPVVVAALLMLASTMTTSVMLSVYNVRYFLITLIASVVISIIFIFTLFLMSKSMYRHVSRMNRMLKSAGAEYLCSLPSPVTILDENGTIVWYNDFFKEKVAIETDAFGHDLRDFISIDMELLKKGETCSCSVNGSIYDVTANQDSLKETTIYTLHFQDSTELFKLQKQLVDSHPSALIIMIDNYDEIMQNAKESEKAKTTVETEQLIENFMNDTNGVAKRISSSTFLVIMEDSHINSIIENKFKILDEARNIRFNDKSPMTLSIGVGQGTETLAESEALARECLDMALGRGGDQAVVKTENGYRFFGGISKGVEKKSRAKTRIIANTMQELIGNSEKIFIMGHRFGDLDSIGSAVGLASAIKLMEKEAFVVVDRKKNLAFQLIDMVESNCSDEYFITPNAACDQIREDDLLIICDTHNKEFLESNELYKKAHQVVIIDHHRKNVNFIDDAAIFHHEPYASSASEMVAELIQYFKLGDKKIPAFASEALLAGIALDTKNFVMRTGVRTFEAAAFLKKIGADTIVVKSLFTNSIDTYQKKTQVVSSAKIHNRCAVAYTEMKADNIRIFCPQAADELLSITDVDASFVLFRTGDIINISARSLGALNVQVIMEALGGGGHQTMAAAQLENISMADAIKSLHKAIDEAVG